jgi:hypothetical protein
MRRAIVVLLLLIANAVVSSSRNRADNAAPSARSDYSLGLLSTIDGAAAGTPRCGVQSAFYRFSIDRPPHDLATRLRRPSAPSVPIFDDVRL